MGNNLAILGKATRGTGIDLDVAKAPGKATQVDLAHPTGQSGIDKGSACATMGPGCFLTEWQRSMLVTEYMARVGATHTAYMSALTTLGIEKLIEKEADLPWWASLLIAAGMQMLQSSLLGALKALQASGPAAVQKLAEAGVNGVDQSKTQAMILGVSESKMKGLIFVASDPVKTQARHTFQTGASLEGRTDRGVSTDFIGYLKDASMSAFETVREIPMQNQITDAELAALNEAFAGHRNTPSYFHQQLSSMVKRYMASHAKDIGRKSELDQGPMRATPVERETRVAYMVIGGVRRLIYVKRDFDPQGLMHAGSAYTGEHALSLADQGTWNAIDGEKQHREVPRDIDGMLGYVEPEFVDVAIMKYEQAWLAAPETFAMNYDTNPPHLSKVIQ